MGNNVALAESATTVYEERNVPEQVQEIADAETADAETAEQQEVEGTEETTEDSGSEVEATEEAEEEEPQLRITVDDVKTAPMDYRFPTTNQAKHCYTRYNEFHKCVAEKGDDADACSKYAKYYRSLCPGEWVDKWNEQRENGTFAGRY